MKVRLDNRLCPSHPTTHIELLPIVSFCSPYCRARRVDCQSRQSCDNIFERVHLLRIRGKNLGRCQKSCCAFWKRWRRGCLTYTMRPSTQASSASKRQSSKDKGIVGGVSSSTSYQSLSSTSPMQDHTARILSPPSSMISLSSYEDFAATLSRPMPLPLAHADKGSDRTSPISSAGGSSQVSSDRGS
jgi:hypothetical protein